MTRRSRQEIAESAPLFPIRVQLQRAILAVATTMAKTQRGTTPPDRRDHRLVRRQPKSPDRKPLKCPDLVGDNPQCGSAGSRVRVRKPKAQLPADFQQYP